MPRCRREVGLRAQASTAGGWAVAVKHLRVMPRGRVMRSFDETVRDECDGAPCVMVTNHNMVMH